MNFSLTDEQQMWRRAVHDFCANEIKPHAAEWETQGCFDQAVLPKMARLGLLGLTVPEAYGGAGVDAVSAAIAIEELGWADGGTALSLSAHNGLACAPIANYADDEQRERWLPDLVSGEAGLASLALTEPGAGSDLVGGVRTRASLQDGEWVIQGQKAWITNASLAPLIVTLCRTDEDGGSRSLSLIVIPADAEGVGIHPPEQKLGTKSSPTHAITFDKVRVPEDHILGEVGRGLYQTLETLDGGRIGIGALSVGLAQAALEEAVRYAHERHTFGVPIGQHQSIGFMLADAATQIEAARFMVYRAAWLKDQARAHTKEAAMAKLIASEMAEKVCRDAIQVFGGYGYSAEFPVERMYRDARLMTIGEGTSEVQRKVIAKRILGFDE